jgi:Carboxypeptidase regulatory-like domain
MRATVTCVALLVSFLLLPLEVFAQMGALTGTVRDSSGAVLPGVTVEASSDVLIERARTAVTDGSGQYRIIDLRPGTYTLTFRLAGFQTLVREGVELIGSATLTIPAEMTVGNLQETISVTAESPIIDVQTARHEFVVRGDTINALPISRGYGALLTTIPALMTSGTSEVVSSPTTPQMTFFTAHGGNSTEGRVYVDGMVVAAAFGGGGVSTSTYDITNANEVTITVAGGLGETETGGPSINIVPRSGGNTFQGSAFASGSGSSFRSDNVTDELRAIGIRHGPGIIKQWDVSGSYGGPIKRDRLWFYGTARNYSNMRGVEGVYANAVAGDASRWDYVLDDNVVSREADSRTIYSVRLTSQITERQQVAFSYQYEQRCDGSAALASTADACRGRESNWVALGERGLFGNSSPEAHSGYMDTWYKTTQATWSMPRSNRLLFDAGFSRLAYIPGLGNKPPDTALNLIPVTEQANIYGIVANWTYRGISTYSDPFAATNNWRAGASYVTGANSVKVGYQGGYYLSDTSTLGNDALLSYRFNNQVPNRVTFRIAPWEQANRTMTHSMYVQDQWTKARLTLAGALRYDRASSWSPAEHNGAPVPTIFNPQPITFERTEGVTGYHDLTPRMNAAYDLFGNGKTAIKVNAGKYLDTATNDGIFDDNNPAQRVAGALNTHPNTFRDWTDGNGNKVVDCDLLNPAAHSRGGDTCAQWNNLNFGNPSPLTTVVNPDLLHGWGVRPYDWQFGITVQQEVVPRVSVAVGYNRRWWGNYTITDNQTRARGDFDPWTVTAPVHPELPGGGGYQFPVYNLKPANFAIPSQNWVTRERDYGYPRTAYWHGVDTNVNARLRNGLIFQGGTSTGRGVRDRCELLDNVPELFELFTSNVTGNTTNMDPRGCHQVDRWATTFRALSTYTIPKIDVLVSGTIRSTLSIVPFFSASNGTSQSANYAIPNSVVQQSLGRLPAGGTATGNTTINLLLPGELYPDDRITLVDMRFAKVLRFSGRRVDLGVDLYNLFNSSFASLYDQTFDYAPTPENPQGWMQPTTIVQPRFVRLNVTVNF